MPHTTISGVDYHYELKGQGPPLVLLHGFTGSLINWTPLVEGLQDRFTLLTVDLVGHGQTDAPTNPQRYHMQYAAADLIALIDATVGPPCHLLGYSMGGRLALYTAVQYPDKFMSLILESASPGLAIEAERDVRWARDNDLADRIERAGITAFVDYWEALPLFASQQRLPDEVRRLLRSQRLNNLPAGLANSLRGMGTGAQPSLWDRLPALSMPTLLLAGELDGKFVGLAQQMYDLIPEAQLQIVPNAGHTIHLEAPVIFQNLVTPFLSKSRRL